MLAQAKGDRMKLWKTATMATALGFAAPHGAEADAGLIHVSPALTMAQPCSGSDGCAFTWTLATRFGVALNFAEQRYGRRDLNWTLLGVDFAQIPTPQVFYAGYGSGRQDIVVQLTASAARNEKQALFQMAHEVIHTLSPIGPNAAPSMLEEGIATYNSLDYVRSTGTEIGPGYISSDAYESAYWLIIELEAAQPDFQARTVALRQRHGSLSELTARKIKNAYPSISNTLAQRLAQAF